MDARTSLGAALLGGYLLGRTKKGGMALRLAIQMSGYRPADVTRSMLQSEQVNTLVQELRGPVMEALRTALEQRVETFTKGINQRTEALAAGAAGTATDTADTATSAVADTTDTIKKATGQSEEEEPEDLEDTEDTETEEAEDLEDLEDEGEPEEDGADTDEADLDDEDEEAIQERAAELKRKRLPTLKRMAGELEFDEEDIESWDKTELTEQIARAEAEDQELVGAGQ